MLIIKNKIALIILFLLISIFTYGQEFKPFLEGSLTEHCSKIKILDDKVLVLQNVMEPPVGGFTTQHTDIPANSFSQICFSDFRGNILKCLAFPDNDSTYYFAEYFEILDNGKIAIGGSINPPDNSVTPFFCVVDEELNSFEFIEELDTLSFFTVSFNTFNNNIYISDESLLLQYNSAGVKVNAYNFNSDTITNPFNFDNSFFGFNNKLYYHYQNGFVNQDKNYLVEIDNNFNISEDYTNVFIDRPNNLNLRLAKRGLLLNNNYIISGVLTNPTTSNDNFPSVFKFGTSNEFEILYVDSTIKISGNVAFHLENQLDIFDANNIFSCYPISDSTEEGLVVYSITGNGTLNWKQKVLLENGFEFPTNTGVLSNTLAVNNLNEIFLTIEVKDNFNKKDVYIIKLDSLGNPIDFTTSVFSFSKEETNKPILLFPNPAQEQLNIKTNLKGNFKLEIFDIQGKLVSSFFDISNDTQINLGKFDKGNYFYKIISEQEKEIQTGEFLKK